MICPNCEHRNPESNRFCGMCGSKLDPVEPQERSTEESTTAENGGRRPFIVSTTAMADVTAQMLNSRVVLPSPTLASSHSGYASPLKPQSEHVYQEQTLVPPEALAASHEFDAESESLNEESAHETDLDSPDGADAERWLEHTAAEHESRMPPPVSSTSTSGSILGLSAPVADSSYAREEAREAEPVQDRNSFLYIDDTPHDHSRDVSGPSFLGLGGDDVAYEEEEPGGRGRRYLLLAMLGIVAILGALEWRASQNGESTNPMDVLHLKLPAKKGQGQVQVVPPKPDSTGSTPAAPEGAPATPPNTANDASANQSANASTAGKPDLIADTQAAAPKPTTDNTSPNAGKTSPPESPATATQNASNTTPSNPSQAPAASSPAGKAPSKPIEIAHENPPVSERPKPAASEPTKTTKPTPSKPAPAPAEAAPEQDASLSAGGAELQKGIAAGSTELGRMWLWKATAKGNGEAPVLLADMYVQGKGVPKDCEQAVLLLNAAAKKMNVRARSKLGSMYAAGECVPQDRVKAYKWMSAALEANPGSEWLEKNREALLRDMSPAERQRASR